MKVQGKLIRSRKAIFLRERNGACDWLLPTAPRIASVHLRDKPAHEGPVQGNMANAKPDTVETLCFSA
jgi:hypothetical protein